MSLHQPARRPASLSSGGPQSRCPGGGTVQQPCPGDLSNRKGHNASDGSRRPREDSGTGTGPARGLVPLGFAELVLGLDSLHKNSRNRPRWLSLARQDGWCMERPGDPLRPCNGDVEDEGEDGTPVAPHSHILITRVVAWASFPGDCHTSGGGRDPGVTAV